MNVRTSSVIVFALALSVTAVALDGLLRDSGFNEYTTDKPGPWEFRYGHKGGNYPDVRPLWHCIPRSDRAEQTIGAYLSVEKRGNRGAGAVLVGQRVTLPDPLPALELSVSYQALCSGSDRSGIVALCVFTPEKWDSLSRDQATTTATVDPADIYHETIQHQGDDVTTWTRKRAKAAALQSALARYAGKTVVVAVSFLTWHDGQEEWARFDRLWLGDPLPFVEPHQWPRYVYRGEPVTLRVAGSAQEPNAGFVLEHRPAGSREPWQRIDLAPAGTALFQGELPATATATPVEIRARAAEGSPDLVTPVATIKLTERPSHPNLFYSRAELARMREKIDEFDWAKRVFDYVKRNADSWLTREFKPEAICGWWWHHYGCGDCGRKLSMEGPRRHVCRKCDKVWDTDILFHVYWSKVHGDHARAVRDLGLAYQMTGDERYARRAIEFLAWYADNYAAFPASDKGGKVVSQTLDECVWLLQMMEGADLVYPLMSKDEARHIEQDLIYAGARHTRKYRGGIHNIRCWHNSCWAAAGYFVGDPELVEFARDHNYGFVAQMERGVLEDGMWYERSMGYHSYTISAITYQLKAAMHAGDDLYQMPQVRKLLTFPVMITFPNLVPPSLNDGGFSTGPIGPNRLELAAAWYDDPVAVGAIRKRLAMGASRANMEAWQFGEAFPEGVDYTPPPSMDMKGAGLAVLRRGTGDAAACAMLEYGDHGGGHGHPDKLQLIFYALGDQRFPDLGTTGYANPLHPRFYKTTPAHNTVTIGGRNMAPKAGELLAFEDSAHHAAAVARSDQVYAGYTLTRRLLLTDSFLVDEFSIDGEASDTLDWFLRANGDLALDIDMERLDEKSVSAPYSYLKNIKAAQTDDAWTATWTFGKSDTPTGRPRLVLTMKGEAGTQVAQARAPGAARSGDYWPTLRVRRQAAQTRFVAVHQIVPAGAEPAIVTFADDTVSIGQTRVELPPEAHLPPALTGAKLEIRSSKRETNSNHQMTE